MTEPKKIKIEFTLSEILTDSDQSNIIDFLNMEFGAGDVNITQPEE